MGPTNDEPASITLFGDARGTEKVLKGLSAASVRLLPSGLPCVDLLVNGVRIPALLDTGSPITVLNTAAAAAAGVKRPAATDDPAGNPLAAIAARFRAVQAARGDVLTMAGASGQPVRLERAGAAAAG